MPQHLFRKEAMFAIRGQNQEFAQRRKVAKENKKPIFSFAPLRLCARVFVFFGR
jgi:hypothetical protein